VRLTVELRPSGAAAAWSYERFVGHILPLSTRGYWNKQSTPLCVAAVRGLIFLSSGLTPCAVGHMYTHMYMMPFGMEGNSTKSGYDTVHVHANVKSSGIDRPSYSGMYEILANSLEMRYSPLFARHFI
jgi:hypothetical protein